MNAVTLQTLTEQVVGNKAAVYTVARDKIRDITFPSFPAIVHVNTGDSSSKGIHWVSYYVFQNENEEIVSDYFDSYSLKPTAYKISFPFPVSTFNNYVLQSQSSNKCGFFCLLFAFYRTSVSPFSFEKFYKHFSRNKTKNDSVVIEFYRNVIKARQKCKTFSCVSKRIALSKHGQKE